MDLCNFFLECAKIERTIELSRQNLTKIPTFHPYSTFKEIDQHQQGCITAQSLQIFLHRLGHLHTLRECAILFYKTEFKYFDFLRFLLPTNQLLRDFISQQDQKVPQTLICLTEVAKHISLEINLMNSLLPPKSLDTLENGTKEELGQIFKKQRVFVYQDEIDAMIRRLDFYGDGQIDVLLVKNWILILNQQSKVIQEREYNSAYVTPKKGAVVINQIRSTEKSNKVHSSALREKLMKQSSSKTNTIIKNNYLQQKSKLRGQIALNKQKQETEKKCFLPGKQLKTRKKSPLEILEYLIDKEIKIEKLKQQLSLQKDFNIKQAFNVLDIYKRGFIGQEEIRLNLQVQSNQDFSYSDFVNFVQPYQANYAEILNTRELNNTLSKKLSEVFTKQTIQILKELFNLENQIPVKLESNIQLFNKIDGITRDNFLGVSDVLNNLNQLQQYFYENQLKYSHHDVMLLINRYDKDRDGRLSLAEFLDM